jgi:monoamine oxidase
MLKNPPEVIVVGAGAAGLAAAYELSRRGRSVLVLESADRVGGRILTTKTASGHPVELGAEFVHGEPPALCRIIRDHHLQTEPVRGEFLCFEEGRLQDCHGFFEDADRVLQELPKNGPDMSFEDFLRSQGSEFSADARKRACSFVEGFNAADPARISVRSLVQASEFEERHGGDVQMRIASGYSVVPDTLMQLLPASLAEVKVGRTVTEIRWSPGEVRLSCDSNDGQESCSARCCIITVPIGVLQRSASGKGRLRIEPFPDATASALRQVAMGNVVRFTLEFDKIFWPKDMSFLFAQAEAIPTWWSRTGLPLITGWCAGPRCAPLLGLSSDQLADRALPILAKMLGETEASLRQTFHNIYFHDWHNDPCTLGAYSYVVAGGVSAPFELARPVANTLFFAGEATDANGRSGTVDGAIASGQQAAQMILEVSK